MNAEEIMAAQHPIHGWDRQTRAFSPTARIDQAPRWAIASSGSEKSAQRARAKMPTERSDGHAVTPDERRALEVLGLGLDATRHDLRSRYSQLVRKYHPDRNGGDRSFETRLQAVIEAYQLLRQAAAFA
jgi:DnaJ-domain-containing protein 1